MPIDYNPTQEEKEAFLLRAKYTYGWENLESQARRMVEHALYELHAQKPTTPRNVTHDSAVAAIEHMQRLGGPGRREQAISMLVPVQSIAADQALRDLEREFPAVVGSGVVPPDESGA